MRITLIAALAALTLLVCPAANAASSKATPADARTQTMVLRALAAAGISVGARIELFGIAYVVEAVDVTIERGNPSINIKLRRVQ